MPDNLLHKMEQQFGKHQRGLQRTRDFGRTINSVADGVASPVARRVIDAGIIGGGAYGAGSGLYNSGKETGTEQGMRTGAERGMRTGAERGFDQGMRYGASRAGEDPGILGRLAELFTGRQAPQLNPYEAAVAAQRQAAIDRITAGR
jgi:hypothetical protein